jgi:FeS assembly SUF system protein
MTMTTTNIGELRRRIITALRTIRDPEVPVNIYDLGLIYELFVTAEGDVRIRMTLTSPNCPIAEAMPRQVEAAVRGLEGVRNVRVDLVWEPIWSPQRMSEAARLELSLSGVDVGPQVFIPAESLFRKQH